MEPSNEHAMQRNAHADRYLTYGPCFLVLACCTPFTAVLASAMAEGDSSDNKGPAGSGEAQGTTLKYDGHDQYQSKMHIDTESIYRMVKNS